MIPPVPGNFDESQIPLWASLLAPAGVLAFVILIALRVWRARPGRKRRKYLASKWSPMFKGNR